MTLLFGKLVQQFVDFTIVVTNANAGVPGASEQVPAAAADFRNSAAKLALGLVYIGALHTYTEGAL